MDVFPTPPLMLYVARTFTAGPELAHPSLARRAHEASERVVEVLAGPVLLGVQVADQLAHGQHACAGCPSAIISSANSRSDCRCTSESWNRPRTSCRPLRSATARLAGRLVDHRREHLERVAQLLAPASAAMQVLRR